MPQELNFIERTPNEICLLCRRNSDAHIAHSNATNSHFTPMGLIQSNTGRRNYEHAITISLNDGNTHRIYYGRSNLQNTDPEIKNDPHAKDYIFCQECEDKLGLLEGEMIDYLNTKIRHPNQVQNFPATILTDKVFFKECLKINTLKFKLFIYSILWRQNLQQQLKFQGKGVISPESEKRLRETIVSGLYEKVENNPLIINCFPFSLITANGFENATKHIISPHPVRNYPEIFCINEYIALLYDKEKSENEEELINRDFFGLPIDVFNEELDNVEQELIRIIFISDECFQSFHRQTLEYAARLKIDAIAKDEFKIALHYINSNLDIQNRFIFIDRNMDANQMNIIGSMVNLNADWVNVEDRQLLRFKILQFPLPNRRGVNVPVYAGILEIRNADGTIYHRLGLYGEIE